MQFIRADLSLIIEIVDSLYYVLNNHKRLCRGIASEQKELILELSAAVQNYREKK